MAGTHSLAQSPTTQQTADHLSRDQLHFERKDISLGSGNYGVVLRGTLTVEGETSKVAVKTVKDEKDPYMVQSFQADIKSEYASMKDIGNHENVIRLVGLVTDTTSPMLVLELLDTSLYKLIWEPQISLLEQQKYRILTDVSNGLVHVHNAGYVHRDVAARNVLVNIASSHAKIGDFGLARKLDNSGQFKTVRSEAPWKWTAVECFNNWTWTKASDVWSFGVLLYEIHKPRTQPYNDMTEVRAPSYDQMKEILIAKGLRLQMTEEEASKEMRNLMGQCFLGEDDRPSMENVHVIIERLVTEHGPLPIALPPPKPKPAPKEGEAPNDVVDLDPS